MRLIFMLTLILLLVSCTHKKDIAKETLHINKNQKETSFAIVETDTTPPPITIWVHGTILFFKSFYQSIFNGQSGLFLAKNLPSQHHFHILADTITQNDPLHFSLEEFYIFAWSGRLSAKERKMASKTLHKELSILIENYQKKYGCYPTIRIIAHSHGGNVVLHMAKKESQTPISIKSLVLLACPVQEKTMHLINMPMFNHIYSLYSSIDMIQVIAPQLRHHHTGRYTGRRRYKLPGFSARLFPTFPHVIQAKIKLNGYPILHTHFAQAYFIAMLPTILEKLDSWDSYLQKEDLLPKHKLLCIYKPKKH